MNKIIKCANCEWKGDLDGEDYVVLDEVPDLQTRLEVGQETPAGACPDCGAFVFLMSSAYRQMMRRTSPSDVCHCPEHCHAHGRSVFEEQRAKIDEFMGGGLQHKEENDYVLKDGVISCWITVDNLSVYVHRADEGVVADIFAHGSEMTEPLGSTWVTRDDAQEVLDSEKEGGS